MDVIFFMSVYKDKKDFQENPAYSGGDNILVNLLRRWQDFFDIQIFTWDGGQYFLESLFEINRVKYCNAVKLKRRWQYPLLLIVRALKGIRWALGNENIKTDFIYSASDFIPDSIPAFVTKLKNPEITWIASFYLFFPHPFSSENPYKGKRRLIGLLQYLAQFPVKYTIRWFADIVFVTSEPDKAFFVTKRRKSESVIVVKGGVNTEECERIGQQPIKFDGVFMGRFHPQKGVIELIKIWKLVATQLAGSKLAIIGQGDATFEERKLKKEMLALIERFDLDKNVELLGFLNGDEKIRILKSSRVVLHPAIYDSGGMAACEAMACGLPGVSFDLEALKTYYPKGMLKTKCFDLQEFAENTVALLSNRDLYDKLSKEALELVQEEWDWDMRAKYVYDRVIGSTG
jgi:glycosyltransferase involved in cell wall biosynthesis